jgi:hypothetical protein
MVLFPVRFRFQIKILDTMTCKYANSVQRRTIQGSYAVAQLLTKRKSTDACIVWYTDSVVNSTNKHG